MAPPVLVATSALPASLCGTQILLLLYVLNKNWRTLGHLPRDGKSETRGFIISHRSSVLLGSAFYVDNSLSLPFLISHTLQER